MKIKKINHLHHRVAPYLRFRHVRGHGIHSPFVYSLVRNALTMQREVSGANGELFALLRGCGIGRRRASQIQNLHNYCDYRFAVVSTSGGDPHPGEAVRYESPRGEGTLRVFTAGCPPPAIEAAAREAAREKGAIVVVSPRADKERYLVCKRLTQMGDSISIDNRGFSLFIYGSGHAARHYKL